MNTNDTPFYTLFSLESKEAALPLVATAYHESSLQFLEGIHRRKSEDLKLLLQAYGWKGLAAANPHAQEAAFMIVHHADYDIALQRDCHAQMLQSVREGNTQPSFLAFLTDRILCNEGHHQRFGTQVREVSNGCFVPKPIEDPDQVDVLRDEVGLMESLSEYLQRINNGDLVLFRPLLNGYAEELEEIKENKVIEFPKKKG